ncbi:MAG: response regulator [Flavobacteriaceae bacterium]
MIQIIIADDHEIVLEGIISLIDPNDGIEIKGTASNGEQVVPLLEGNQVDIAVLDINMPGIDGIDLTKLIKEKHPSVKILILSMYNEIGYIRKAIEAGAHGYILKNKGKEEFTTAIKEIHQGRDYFGEEVKTTLIASHRSKEVHGEIRLTKREKEVLHLIANGYTTPQISESLHIANSTVETHRRNLIEKTGVGSTKGLVKYAIENGYG